MQLEHFFLGTGVSKKTDRLLFMKYKLTQMILLFHGLKVSAPMGPFLSMAGIKKRKS